MNRTSKLFTGKYISLDGLMLPGSDFDWNVVENTKMAYEVLRIIQSKPLFLEDHFIRFEKSIKFLGLPDRISLTEVARQIQELCRKNTITTGNIKLVYGMGLLQTSNDRPNLLISFIPHKYPSAAEYQKGITLKTLQLERPNPNAKIIHQNINLQVSYLKAKTGADEILLINHEGVLTEGSKSNIFFIQQNNILTAEKSLVLAGITREKVIELCEENGLNLKECEPSADILREISGVFITGTSPKIMAVRQIDAHDYSTNHPVIKQLQHLYDRKIEDYFNSVYLN